MQFYNLYITLLYTVFCLSITQNILKFISAASKGWSCYKSYICLTVKINQPSDGCAEQVSIPSQRRYVNYWEKVLSFPKRLRQAPPDVNLPEPVSRELIRIRLYDTQNVDSVFCVVSELQNVSQINWREWVFSRWNVLEYGCF